jgi:hypothetical protein
MPGEILPIWLDIPLQPAGSGQIGGWTAALVGYLVSVFDGHLGIGVAAVPFQRQANLCLHRLFDRPDKAVVARR